jgi:Flp pilus assembly protein TadD
MSLRRSTVLLLFLLLFDVFLAYSNHFHNQFHFDDFHTITDNPNLQSLANVPRFFTDATTFSTLPANRSYRPLLSASLALDYWNAGGLEPAAFHLQSFLWFLLQLALMLGLFVTLLERLCPHPANRYIALFAVAWYGLHPVNAETVNYIIQRGDLLSTLGVVAGMWTYIAFPGARRYGLHLIPVALACLAKPPAVVFPLLLLAYLTLSDERPRWLDLLPAIVVIAAMSGLIAVMTPDTYAPAIISGTSYRLAQPVAALHYFRAFFLPLWLTADTDQPPRESVDGAVLLGVAFLGVLVATIGYGARRRELRPIAFGLAWFVIALLPTSLFTLSEVENDHRMFFPFVGLTLAATSALALIVRRVPARHLALGAACLLAAYGFGTHQRNEVWRTPETLWHDVTVKSPRNGRGLMNYGLALMRRGDYEGALSHFERALAFTPNYALLEVNLGIATDALRRHEEAERHFQRAVSLEPADDRTLAAYARWLESRERTTEAIQHAQLAAKHNASALAPRHLLMQLYLEQGSAELATVVAEETLAIAPDDRTARECLARASALPTTPANADQLVNLSLHHFQRGSYGDSIDAARKALVLRPDYAEAYNNLAAAYAARGDWDDAIQAALAALRLNPALQLARNNLAWAEREKAAARTRK